jgi:hypothetical protein
MTITSTTGRTSPLVGTFPACLNFVRRAYTRMIAARQKRADVHNAMYLRGLPAEVARRLDLPPDVATALRDRERWAARATLCS